MHSTRAVQPQTAEQQRTRHRCSSGAAAAPPPRPMDARSAAAGDQALSTLFQISQILDCGLSKDVLRILVGLCEAGVNPEALALIVRELRREAAALGNAEVSSASGVH